MRRAAVGAGVVAMAIASLGFTGASATAGRSRATHTLVVHGVVRTYRVHVPKAASAARPMPLVVVLHGAGATASEVERRYHWDALADRDQFVVAYPQAIDLVWNTSASPSGPDDVGFLRALLDELESKHPIDRAHEYITGISNGGIMTYRAGCALTERLAAIGPVAAWFPDCQPAVPLAVIHIHGLADDQLLYAGGSGYPPVETGLARWRSADGCPTTPEASTEGVVTRRSWGPCAGGTAMTVVTIADGQHEWPGAIPKAGNEKVSTAIDATREIWAFFQAHAR